MALDYERKPVGIDPDGWFTASLANDGRVDWFPARCCVCLTETDHFWKVPHYYHPKAVDIRLPICPQCLRRSRQKIRMAQYSAALVTLLSALLALAIMLMCRASAFDLTIVCCGVLGLGWSLGIQLAPHHFALPIELGRWSKGQETIQLRFRNRDYWPLLEQCWQVQAAVAHHRDDATDQEELLRAKPPPRPEVGQHHRGA